jgi:aspartyl-tRNA(Asn)/glutamyl-tRNA(Gln) amidotransferase subunit A
VAIGEDVLYATVSDLASRIKAKRLSPVELTEAYLARIDTLDPKLHAFATVTRDLALEQARRAEKEIATGKYRGPLHGIPYGAKDLVATKGIRTTWGAKPFESQQLDYDATIVRKLADAGAVLLGKLAMVELAGGMGYTIPAASLTGAALNPWDTGRWTCGSSSGSGAAVAAGLVAFAIGSETWGSIVCPSTFCGISGLRPTFGRVSRHGAMALSWTMDKLGPMARSAADCETLLGALSGRDPEDDWSSDEPAGKPIEAAAARNFKAGYVKLDFAKSGEPEVQAAYEKAIADLKAAGLAAEEVTLPDLPFEPVAGMIIGAEASSAFEDLFRDGRIRQLADKGAPIARATSSAMTAADYVKASRIRTVMQKEMAGFFAKWDVLLAPGVMMTAFPADRSFADVPWSDPVGAMGNLCGLPAVSVPCGFGKAGLPAGLVIVSGAFEDTKALAAAKLYQGATDWHRKRPPVS